MIRATIKILGVQISESEIIISPSFTPKPAGDSGLTNAIKTERL